MHWYYLILRERGLLNICIILKKRIFSFVTFGFGKIYIQIYIGKIRYLILIRINESQINRWMT